MIAAAVSVGITVRDLEDMTIGMVADVMSEFIPEKDRVRKATQADMDALRR